MATSPDDILDLIERRRRDDVAAAVCRVRDEEGFDAAIGLLTAVQSEVGARWQSRRWTVADEHAASAIVDHALTVAGATAGSRSEAPRAVVACVEDEWHVLPARMLAEQLRNRGWDPVFLGASAPAGHLGHFAGRTAPVAAALSCSMPLHLPGARRSVAACHAVGVPVVVGGSAFPDSRRAEAIGADAWCRDVAQLVEVLERWARTPPTLATPSVPEPPAFPSLRRRQALDTALDVLVRRIPPLADAAPHELAQLRDDLDGLLASAEAAAHVDDSSIVDDQVAWMRSVSDARGEPPGLTAVAVEALASAVPDSVGLRRELSVQV